MKIKMKMKMKTKNVGSTESLNDESSMEGGALPEKTAGADQVTRALSELGSSSAAPKAPPKSRKADIAVMI